MNAHARPARARSGARDEWRMSLMIFCVVLVYLAVGVRMGLLAATDPSEPALAEEGAATTPVRGEVTDRNGTLMAGNLPAWSLYAHPGEVKEPVEVATKLAAVFPDEDREQLIRLLTSKNRFVWIKRPISPRQKQAVMDIGAPGLFFGAREVRVYPAGRTAGHILGGVKAEREDVRFAELVGSAGAELYFDEALRDPARAETPLALSIDLSVQQALREVLAAGMTRMEARGAAGILMKVQTGEIVAMVSLPDFDPNDRPEVFRGEAGDNPRFNRAAQGRYELGSTFKVLTAAMALDAGVVLPATKIDTPPALTYGRRRIRDFHAMPAQMSVEQIVVKSSNVGSAKLAMMLGTKRFRGYLDRLGMFDASGLELGEAAAARPLLPERWTDLSTITISYGHGLAASPVHLAAAYATVANDGVRVFPSLIAGGRPNGERVFRSAVSKQMLAIMREVVRQGTARRGDVPGFEIGGKTGTAEKVKPGGGYYSNKVISTFASVFPTSKPEYVLVVTLDEPTDRSGRTPVRTAGRTAVPVAADVIRRVTPLLGMRPLPAGLVGAAPLAVETGQ